MGLPNQPGVRDVAADYKAAYIHEYEQLRAAGLDGRAKETAAVLREQFDYDVSKAKPAAKAEAKPPAKPEAPERADVAPPPENTAEPKPKKRAPQKQAARKRGSNA